MCYNAQLKGKNQNPFTQPSQPEPQNQTEPKMPRVFCPFELFVMTAAPNRTKLADPKNKMNEHQRKGSRHRIFDLLNPFDYCHKAVSQRTKKAHLAPARAYSRNKDISGKSPTKRNAASP